jgi:hypothetical protein
MPPLPLPIDMAALSTFNADLASQALPQLYCDGHVSLALEWAARLDPFSQGKVLNRAKAAEPLEKNSFLQNASPYAYGSLVDLILKARDTTSLDALACQEGFTKALFTNRLDQLAVLVASEVEHHPEFASYIFERMSPRVKTERTNRYSDSNLSRLAHAAAKTNHLSWLSRINDMRQATEGVMIPGYEIAHSHFLTPPHADGVQALLDIDCVSEKNWSDVAIALMRSEAPSDTQLALTLLDKDYQHSISELETPLDRAQISQRFSSRALYLEPEKTPLPWLEFYLSKGLDSFNEPTDGTINASATLVGLDWRETGRRHFSPDPQMTQKRLTLDALICPLLEAMMDQPDVRLNLHLDLQCFSKELRGAFRGARKIDLLSACIGQGFYRCADALVARGADWKFAAKQCAQWLRRSSPSMELDTVDVARAYCEALSLRHISLKASLRRDDKLAKLGEPSLATPRSHRL